MEYTVTDGRVLGVVLDVSLNYEGDKRIIDCVKKSLVELVKDVMQGDDFFYLYHPEIIDPVNTIGAAVGDIGNYQTDGCAMDLRHALLQTFYVMCAEDYDMEKTLLYITDRVKESRELKKLLDIGLKEDNCNFIFVGIGNRYDKKCLKQFEESVSCHYLENVEDLTKVFKE